MMRPLPDAEDVLRFLEANPDFLMSRAMAANPGGAASGRLISLSRESIRRAREAIRRSDSDRRNMADISATNRTSQARVFQAACLMMAAQSPADVITAINDHLPEILDLHAARLVITPQSVLAHSEATLTCPEAVVDTLTDAEGYHLGPPHAAHKERLGAILPPHDTSIALARLPALLEDAAPPMHLALIGRSLDTFTPSQGTELLAFTVTLIAIALSARGEAA